MSGRPTSPPIRVAIVAAGSTRQAHTYFSTWSSLLAAIAAIAYQNKAKVYALLFTAAAEALTTIAAHAKHLAAKIGVTAVLHTWGQNLDHRPPYSCCRRCHAGRATLRQL